MPLIDPNAIRKGDRLALSRALTAVENSAPESRSIQAALFPHTGKAHLIGITGPPGTGKSTLVNQLVKLIRQSNTDVEAPTIAIIAVDPTSPFTGGALLGDRIRMQDLAGDKGVFIRSMASRGALGGIAHQTAAFATILDAAGFDLIMIETVGAGQAEVDIARLAHTVVVVEAPGLGDDIQAIKAGILEIADILVINKADRPGADNSARALSAMLEMAGQDPRRFQPTGKHGLRNQPSAAALDPADNPVWETPVMQIIATEGKGINSLVEKIQHHRDYLISSGLWQVKEAYRLRQDLEALIREKLIQQWRENISEERFEAVLADVIQRNYSPIEAVETLV